MIARADLNTSHTLLVGQALRQHQAGDFAGAEAIYRQVLAQDPGHADALHLCGCLAADLGRTDEAISLVTRAVERNPNAYPFHYNLANLLGKQGRQDEAVGHYREAIRLKPDYAQAYNNLGLALSSQGDRPGAMACFEQAIRFKPGYADPYYNLGLALKAEGDLGRAIAAYREAIRIRPDHADAHYNLGNALSFAKRLEDAVAAYRDAIRIRPDSSKVHANLGTVLLKLGRLEDAAACFREALRLDPEDVFCRSNLVSAASYATADPAAMYAECAQWERIHAAPLRNAIEPHANRPASERRLRVGYVSADFRAHAAAYWIEPLLAGHQHGDFEIFCYSNSELADEVTQRLKMQADVWVACAALSDDEMASRIRQDGIDILVDLSGHTDGNRLLVFARQPAPVQVSWFGFPVSTGLKAMNYRLSDSVLDPVGENDRFYSEKLVRLQRFYAAFRPDPAAPPVGGGPVARNGHVTFSSFNNFAKITPFMLALWADILRAVPDSRLLLQSAGLDGTDLGGEVRAFFAKKGVAPERLILRGWTGLNEYLRLGTEADIALDPYPFNGGVTTCHALWMGLPVVTLSGQSAASRVGRSLLGGIGLAELAAENPAQYRDIALGLAKDRARLALLRASLRERMASGGLLDGQGLAREVEAAYRAMWQAWCEETGLAIKPI